MLRIDNINERTMDEIAFAANLKAVYRPVKHLFDICRQLALVANNAQVVSGTWSGAVTSGAAPGIVWSGMPSGKATWLHSSATLTGDANLFVSVYGVNRARLYTAVQVAGAAANTALGVDYSADDTTWNELITLTIGNTTGIKDSGWQTIGGITGELHFRLFGESGNGAASPRFSPVTLLLG